MAKLSPHAQACPAIHVCFLSFAEQDVDARDEAGMTEIDMRFLKRLAIGVVLLIGAAAVVVWFQPDDYRLTRVTVIAAPAADVFARVNDLRQWDDWSPWAKLDPNAKVRSRVRSRVRARRSRGTATTRSAPAR